MRKRKSASCSTNEKCEHIPATQLSGGEAIACALLECRLRNFGIDPGLDDLEQQNSVRQVHADNVRKPKRAAAALILPVAARASWP